MSQLRYYRNPTTKLSSFRWIFLLHLVIGPSGRWTPDTTLANPDISINNFAEIYRNRIKFYNEFKAILIWTHGSYQPFNGEVKTPDTFINNNCSVKNCIFTFDKKFFGEDTARFHAIAFSEKKVKKITNRDLLPRSPHQKYIFFAMESASNYPIDNDMWNDFFNWTATYKLNSDILYNYFLIKDMNGNVVGPKQDMNWVENMNDVDEELVKRLKNKTKAAAWFVSNCKTSSKRERFVSKLQTALIFFNLSLDIYGNCGPFKCPRDDEACDAMLGRDYYFYMALENSFSEDYVTEKVLRAMTHYTVPIVLGGANYSRFLPPGSYLNALEYVNSPIQLAIRMYCLMQSPESYQKFFKWTNHYSYHTIGNHHVCQLCEALNDDSKFENHSVYHDMKMWWNEKNYEPPKEPAHLTTRREKKKRSKPKRKKNTNQKHKPISKMQDVNNNQSKNYNFL